MKPATVAILAGVGALAAIYLIKSAASAAKDGAAEVVGAVGQAINPTSDKNVVYSGINAVGNVLATDPTSPGRNADGSWTLGGWIYDMTHKDAVAQATGTA